MAAVSVDKPTRSSERRDPIVRAAPLLLLAVLQVGLVAVSFSDTLTASGEPPVIDVRATLVWVAAGVAAYVFLIWPLFLFATPTASSRPAWRVALEGVCLLALTVPALAAGQTFSNAPVGRVWLVGTYFASLAAAMIGLARLARRLPAAGRWVLTAAEVVGLGLPLLVYFLADFSRLPDWLPPICPPLAAAALADGSLSPATPLGLAAILAWPALGAIAAGATLLFKPAQSRE